MKSVIINNLLLVTACIVLCLSPFKETGAQQSGGLYEMVLVEGGTFIMGCKPDPGKCGKNAHPAMKMKIEGFRIGKYEVTQALWKKVMGHNPSSAEGDDLPVNSVGWQEALQFCNELSRLEGLKPYYILNADTYDGVDSDPEADGYRLPLEREWEFAAKGGSAGKGYLYAGSNNASEVAVFGGEPAAPGTKNPNELGIYDMSGNVWEWCYDVFGDYGYIDEETVLSPMSLTEFDERVIKGGSFDGTESDQIVTGRMSLEPSQNSLPVGLRLARNK